MCPEEGEDGVRCVLGEGEDGVRRVLGDCRGVGEVGVRCVLREGKKMMSDVSRVGGGGRGDVRLYGGGAMRLDVSWDRKTTTDK